MVLSGPILKLLYPSASEGASMLVLLSVTLPFSSLTYILNGILYGAGKQKIPAATLAVGSAIKLVLNLILVNIPTLNIYGAIIGTIVYQSFVFAVETFFVFRCVELKLNFIKLFIKPFVAAALMSLAVFGAYKLSTLWFGNTVSTLLAICVGVLVYGLAVLLLRTFEKEDLEGLPAGRKIASLLTKFKLIGE